MDLAADMLVAHLPRCGPGAIEVHAVSPSFRRVATRLPVLGRRNAAFNADRLLNRFVRYPRFARTLRGRFDLFHVADHTYAQLVHGLPAGRTGVYCHDVDAFRCLFDPAADPRPRWFRALAGRILSGMQKAAVVFHSTGPVRDEILAHGLIEEGRLVHAPYGVSKEFVADAGAAVPDWLAALDGRPWVAHVGSCIPRKRIDVLLDVVAAVRRRLPDLRLVKVGGDWTADHRERIQRHGLAEAIVHLHGLSRTELAAVYRRAGAVLMTSTAEGFGLPVIEALACGAPVVASDLPVLREVGGDAASHCPVGDVPAWADAVRRTLLAPEVIDARRHRVLHARSFSWERHGEVVAAAYRSLIDGSRCQ